MTEYKNPGCEKCVYYYYVRLPYTLIQLPPDYVWHRCLCPEYELFKYSYLTGRFKVTIRCSKYNAEGTCKNFVQKAKKINWFKKLFTRREE